MTKGSGGRASSVVVLEDKSTNASRWDVGSGGVSMKGLSGETSPGRELVVVSVPVGWEASAKSEDGRPVELEARSELSWT